MRSSGLRSLLLSRYWVVCSTCCKIVWTLSGSVCQYCTNSERILKMMDCFVYVSSF